MILFIYFLDLSDTGEPVIQKWGVSKFQFITPDILDKSVHQISLKESEYLHLNDKERSIFRTVSTAGMNDYQIRSYNLLTNKGIIRLYPHALIAPNLPCASIDIDPQMNAGDGFKVIPIGFQSQLSKYFGARLN